MKILKFIKGPGYLYDLFIMFVFYFNQELFLSEQVNPNKSAEDTEHFTRILNEIKTIPEDLRIFFQLRENNKCFFTTIYFHKRIEEFLSFADLETVQDSLTDYKKVITDIINYYFEAPCTEINYDDPHFFQTVGRMISDSEYDAVLKTSLYKFILDPIPIIQKLINELTKKDVLLSKMYCENDLTISRVQNNTNIDRIEEKLLKIKNTTIDITSFKDVVVSFCLAHKNCILAFASQDKVTLLLGIDYENFSNYLIAKDPIPELEQFGIAFSEGKRIHILEYLCKNGEVSVGDIKNLLKISNTTAYYHITLLLKTNLVKFRNRGKTVYYSINYDYFNKICTMLTKYTEKGEN